MASLSFRGLQLLERPGHDARLSSLEKAAGALGLARGGVSRVVERFLGQHPESLEAASYRILDDGAVSWKLHLFNFVDVYRSSRETSLAESPPADMLDSRIRCLMASTVERLSRELKKSAPSWCASVASLPRPWFVAGLENLKAMALVESPPEFRKREIFVLANFLDRA